MPGITLIAVDFRRCIKKIAISTISLLACAGCIEPYEPRVNQNVLDILVVDGFINATSRTASVRLSHTQSLSETKDTTLETEAMVTIQSASGQSWVLTEKGPGVYSAENLTIDLTTQYTLHIKTTSGAEYRSDSIRIKQTPPIDTLAFDVSSDGENLIILVDAHDPTGQSRYYKWDYVETYEYNAALYSGFHFVNHVPVMRKTEEQVYTCWRTMPSTTISIGTTTGLTEDIVNRQRVTGIPGGSPKISVRYSILVKQMVISLEEYDYLEQLRKTTENLGTIFGNLPTSVTGNIHPVDETSTLALGYFSGAEVTEKRLFIERFELPTNLATPVSKTGCVLEQTCDLSPPPLVEGPQSCVPLSQVSESNIIVNAVVPPGGYNPTSYTFTSPDCGDCRSKGGTTKKPEFW